MIINTLAENRFRCQISALIMSFTFSHLLTDAFLPKVLYPGSQERLPLLLSPHERPCEKYGMPSYDDADCTVYWPNKDGVDEEERSPRGRRPHTGAGDGCASLAASILLPSCFLLRRLFRLVVSRTHCCVM